MCQHEPVPVRPIMPSSKYPTTFNFLYTNPTTTLLTFISLPYSLCVPSVPCLMNLMKLQPLSVPYTDARISQAPVSLAMLALIVHKFFATHHVRTVNVSGTASYQYSSSHMYVHNLNCYLSDLIPVNAKLDGQVLTVALLCASNKSVFLYTIFTQPNQCTLHHCSPPCVFGSCIAPDVCQCVTGSFGVSCNKNCTCQNGICNDGAFQIHIEFTFTKFILIQVVVVMVTVLPVTAYTLGQTVK